MRQIILDTETTGLEPRQGHKIIEIGCIEMIDRRMTGNTFHHYINPEREIDEGAIEVHGITMEMLADKPVFADLSDQLLEFIKGAELIIHNAPFDVGFMNHEFAKAGLGEKVVDEYCEILDTLVMARHKHPGQKNNLDALARRYMVDNSQRQLHGALLDAEILADVYLMMTGGQISLLGESDDLTKPRLGANGEGGDNVVLAPIKTAVIVATEEELVAHDAWLEILEKETPGQVVWKNLLSNEISETT